MSEVASIIEGARAELRSHGDRDVTDVVDRQLHRIAPLADPSRLASLRRAALAELNGLGPLDRWLDDPEIDEIMVNAGRDVWIDRDGSTELVDRLADGQLATIVERIVAPLGLRLDRTNPIVDARLPDGSRLCAVIPPITPDGPCCSIRRFRSHPFSIESFAAPAVAELLRELVRARCNLVVAGATSSGKTSLLNALAGEIGRGERLVTIEDTAELRLGAEHVVRLEARPGTAEGLPPVEVRALVRAALRLRPDRLVVGEVRGAEALDMVQALNTGHDGSLTTCHANGPADTLRRLEAMVLMGAPSWPPATAREQVRGSIDVVVHVARTASGSRRVVAVAELSEPGQTLAGDDALRMLVDGEVLVGRLRRGRR